MTRDSLAAETRGPLADAIRDADDERIWTTFGREIADEVGSAEPSDTYAVVMTLTVSFGAFDASDRFVVSPAITWAVDDVDQTKAKLEGSGDALVVFHSHYPGVESIRRKVADAIEDGPP